MLKKTFVLLLMLAVLHILPACLDETVKPIKEPPPDAWPELTSENNVIGALVWCYDNPSSDDAMTRYESLLHSEYFFRLAAGDVDEGEDPVITKAADIGITRAIFEHQSYLDLDIVTTGDWYDQPELNGHPCEGCRTATREYFIRARFAADGDTWQSVPGKAFVTVIVAPHESDTSKWVIRAIYDLGN